MSKARDIADLDFNSPDIDGGNIDGAVIGGTTPAAGTFSQVNVDNITIDGNEIDVSSGDLTLDVAGDIILDADGAQVRFKDAGTEFFKVSNESGFVQLYSPVSNSDIKFDGNDGGSAITALTLDMSAAGAATFNAGITIPDYIYHTSDANTYFGFPGGDEFELVTAGQSRMKLVGSGTTFNEGGNDKDFRVESNGNTHALFVEGDGTGIGINTSDPQEALHVTGSVRLDGNNNGITSGEAINQIIFKDTDTTTGGGQTMGQIDWTTLDSDAPGVSARISGVADSSTTSQGRLNFFTGAEGTFVNNLTMAAGESAFNQGGVDIDFRVESDNNTHALFIAGVGAAANNLAIGMGTGTITNPYSQTNFTDLNIDGVWGGVISFKLGGTEKGWIGQRNSGNGGMALSSSSGNSLYLNSGGNTSRMEFTSAGHVIVNPTGTTADFTVSSDANTNMLFVDGGSNFVGIGDNTNTGYTLNVAGSAQVRSSFVITSGGGANLTQGDIMIKSSTSDSPSARGQGVFMFNEGADRTWYAGTGYNAGGDYHVGFADSTSSTKEGARTTNSVFSLYNNASGAVFNENGADRDFRVESNGNANMLFVDAGKNRVSVAGNTDPAVTTTSTANVSFYAKDMVVTGTSMWRGFVNGSQNNNNGFVALFDLTHANTNNVGCIFDGKIILQSYTGYAMANLSISKAYIADTVAFVVHETQDGFTNISGISMSLVTATVGGVSYLGIQKTGGGTGTAYIDAFINGSIELKETTSGSYSVTATHGTITT